MIYKQVSISRLLQLLKQIKFLTFIYARMFYLQSWWMLNLRNSLQSTVHRLKNVEFFCLLFHSCVQKFDLWPKSFDMVIIRITLSINSTVSYGCSMTRHNHKMSAYAVQFSRNITNVRHLLMVWLVVGSSPPGWSIELFLVPASPAQLV